MIHLGSRRVIQLTSPAHQKFFYYLFYFFGFPSANFQEACLFDQPFFSFYFIFLLLVAKSESLYGSHNRPLSCVEDMSHVVLTCMRKFKVIEFWRGRNENATSDLPQNVNTQVLPSTQGYHLISVSCVRQ